MNYQLKLDSLLLRLDELKEIPLSELPVTKREIVTLTQIVSDLIEVVQDKMVE